MRDVDKIVSLLDCEGKNFKEQMKCMYEYIGKYFINNSDRLSSDAVWSTQCLDFHIKINGNEIVTIEKKVQEYLTRGN